MAYRYDFPMKVRFGLLRQRYRSTVGYLTLEQETGYIYRIVFIITTRNDDD